MVGKQMQKLKPTKKQDSQWKKKPTSKQMEPACLYQSGGLLIFLGSLQFVIDNVVCITAFHGYSMISNRVSDLGDTSQSPLYAVFDIGAVLFGALGLVGLMLCSWAFAIGSVSNLHDNDNDEDASNCSVQRPQQQLRRASVVLLSLASLGAILLGAFPENVNLVAHDIGSATVFVAGAFATILLGLSMTNWPTVLRVFSIVVGSIMLTASIVYVADFSAPFKGLLERLIVYPLLLWLLIASGDACCSSPFD